MCFLKWWYPQIINFNRVFQYKPSTLGCPYFWKHPYIYTYIYCAAYIRIRGWGAPCITTSQSTCVIYTMYAVYMLCTNNYNKKLLVPLKHPNLTLRDSCFIFTALAVDVSVEYWFVHPRRNKSWLCQLAGRTQIWWNHMLSGKKALQNLKLISFSKKLVIVSLALLKFVSELQLKSQICRT